MDSSTLQVHVGHAHFVITEAIAIENTSFSYLHELMQHGNQHAKANIQRTIIILNPDSMIELFNTSIPAIVLAASGCAGPWTGAKHPKRDTFNKDVVRLLLAGRCPTKRGFSWNDRCALIRSAAPRCDIDREISK